MGLPNNQVAKSFVKFSAGGSVERPFKTLNTELFSTLARYTGSNVQERPEEAEQTRRQVQRGGYLQFENLMYRGELLAGYAGESVVLRYDPKDITTILVYRMSEGKEIFLIRN